MKNMVSQNLLQSKRYLISKKLRLLADGDDIRMVGAARGARNQDSGPALHESPQKQSH
jgi:hypothetical protein